MPMSEPTILSAMTVELTAPSPNKWEREYQAFLQCLPDLLKTHRGQYVAFHGGQMVDSGDDELALASRVWNKYGYVPIHVGLVTELAPLAQMPSFREVPR